MIYRIFLSAISVGVLVSHAFAAVFDSYPSRLKNPLWIPAIKQGRAVVQLGGYWGTGGRSHHVDIQTLIGDTFTKGHHSNGNALVGFGYLIEGKPYGQWNMSYGVNGFYLPKTTVTGKVNQEDLFTNLAYRYSLTHYPVYAMAKTSLALKPKHYALTVDAGLGPNFMRASGFEEHSIDGNRTVPDDIFSSHTTTAFTATVGVGVRREKTIGNAPLELGYRFFYLGQGKLHADNDQLLNTLHTGSQFGNALYLALTIE